MINKLLYLGPAGSYSEVAKDIFSKYLAEDCEFITKDSIYRITECLISGNSDTVGAVIPIENSIEGVVTESQDNLYLLAQNGYQIFAESSLVINHALISYGQKHQIDTITSHPQALAQCNNYINKNWEDNVNIYPVLSTSVAIKSLTPDNSNIAAIGSEYCANLYNAPIIDTCINDDINNKTRFILLSRDNPEKCLQNKISIYFATKNESGALNKILCVLEKYKLNMSHINSRPSKKQLGEYVFYIDFEGHISNPSVKKALKEIQTLTNVFEIISNGAIII